MKKCACGALMRWDPIAREYFCENCGDSQDLDKYSISSRWYIKSD